MRKNKLILAIVGIVLITSVIYFGLTININTVSKKMKADITYPTSKGISISCDKIEIAVNEEIECSLVGHSSGGIRGIDGLFSVSGNVSIQTITRNTNMFSGELENAYFAKDGLTPDDFLVATVTIKGVTEGSGSLTYTGSREGRTPTFVYTDYTEENVNDATANITITNGSTSTDNPDDDEGDDSPGAKSQISSLDSITVNVGTLSPTFDKNIFSYNVDVENSVTSITVSGTKTDSNSNVDGFGTVELSEGENTVEIVVTAEDQVNSSIYIIVVNRAESIVADKSSDNTLRSLSIDGVSFTPQFSAAIDEYTASVENNVTSINVNAVANDENARVNISGNENLAEGNNTVRVKVIAENNAVKTYTIVVFRKKSGNQETCKLELKSTVYKIDNEKGIIDLVQPKDTVDDIKKNIAADCGTISVTEDTVLLSFGDEVKKYTISKYENLNTGNNVVRWTFIITGIIVILGALFIINRKMNK